MDITSTILIVMGVVPLFVVAAIIKRDAERRHECFLQVQAELNNLRALLEQLEGNFRADNNKTE
jgi:hypothetical protein